MDAPLGEESPRSTVDVGVSCPNSRTREAWVEPLDPGVERAKSAIEVLGTVLTYLQN
jgi:hypothetical protein